MSYVTIDDAILAIVSLGKGSQMAKTDIESAFRQFPVHPDAWELLGMKWEEKYYFDKVLPFGLRSAPFLFNQLSEALEWILDNKCGISFVTHLLDDFLIIEPAVSPGKPQSKCQESLSGMLLAFRNLGIPLAANKTQGPSTELEFLGIILDYLRMQARLPEDKIARLKEELNLWTTKRNCNVVNT